MRIELFQFKYFVLAILNENIFLKLKWEYLASKWKYVENIKEFIYEIDAKFKSKLYQEFKINAVYSENYEQPSQQLKV